MNAADVAAMSPEERRVRIAEICGWELREYVNKWGDEKIGWFAPDGRCLDGIPYSLPDYLADLNAMADMEKTLQTDEQITDYMEALTSVCGGDVPEGAPSFTAYFATAAQRAEAFLRVMG